MAHLLLEGLPRAAVDCTRFTLVRTGGTPPSLCSVSALSLELSAACEVRMYVCMYVQYAHVVVLHVYMYMYVRMCACLYSCMRLCIVGMYVDQYSNSSLLIMWSVNATSLLCTPQTYQVQLCPPCLNLLGCLQPGVVTQKAVQVSRLWGTAFLTHKSRMEVT